jgi:hypothetical protein
MTTTITDLDDFRALDPSFHIIEKGLDGIADGEHYPVMSPLLEMTLPFAPNCAVHIP